MNLYSVINAVCTGAMRHPFVNSFHTDIYTMVGNKDDIEYPAFILTQNQHQASADTLIYSFNLLYADRMTDDRRNACEIQSVGMDVIRELVNYLEDNHDVRISRPVNINTYKDQFADLCAGCVANVSITVANDIGDCSYIQDPVCYDNC